MTTLEFLLQLLLGWGPFIFGLIVIFWFREPVKGFLIRLNKAKFGNTELLSETTLTSQEEQKSTQITITETEKELINDVGWEKVATQTRFLLNLTQLKINLVLLYDQKINDKEKEGYFIEFIDAVEKEARSLKLGSFVYEKISDLRDFCDLPLNAMGERGFITHVDVIIDYYLSLARTKEKLNVKAPKLPPPSTQA